ncbi:hypothetical protein R3X27_11875 [Tropicimonas sp. TH_r6]|uniref:hypothetical protein n=1 Tax=Tropicimonas sp. TH_r6 TaxID=3082085 RepID=UPI0029557F2B|nr:hypothetical protein [Tropicimonas sp. TH_r6]MDV7143381.1 hypothetical protein [Tropicimonas sp. TH_r6]
MFLELIAAVFAAAAAAGIVMLLNHMTGKRLPRWLMPAAAGVTMILFTIRMEYSWYERTVAEFPEGVVITQTHESSAFWRPWTYFAPLTDRFVAMDPAAVQSNEAVPHQRIVEMLFFGRWKAPEAVPMVIDCDTRQGAPMLDSVTFDADGAVAEAKWAPIPEDDLTFATVCKETRP